jgi:hypothetical protein
VTKEAQRLADAYIRNLDAIGSLIDSTDPNKSDEERKKLKQEFRAASIELGDAEVAYRAARNW